VENVDLNVVKLYITHIEEGDDGIYGCRAVINDEVTWKNLTLLLFRKYTVWTLGYLALFINLYHLHFSYQLGSGHCRFTCISAYSSADKKMRDG